VGERDEGRGERRGRERRDEGRGERRKREKKEREKKERRERRRMGYSQRYIWGSGRVKRQVERW
jgi:hypothetical protein